MHTCAAHVAIDFEIAVVTGGATMTIDGIEVFTTDEDGLFATVHAYWDDADLSFESVRMEQPGTSDGAEIDFRW